MTNPRDVDALIRESQRLRDELIKTAARLNAFAEELVRETSQLTGGVVANDDSAGGQQRGGYQGTGR